MHLLFKLEVYVRLARRLDASFDHAIIHRYLKAICFGLLVVAYMNREAMCVNSSIIVQLSCYRPVGARESASSTLMLKVAKLSIT